MTQSFRYLHLFRQSSLVTLVAKVPRQELCYHEDHNFSVNSNLIVIPEFAKFCRSPANLCQEGNDQVGIACGSRS